MILGALYSHCFCFFAGEDNFTTPEAEIDEFYDACDYMFEEDPVQGTHWEDSSDTSSGTEFVTPGLSNIFEEQS